ncbi:unnamed protein product [Trichogramma brassicae]|uniref:Uncharacterized protein n=1 Tax=Trichogramma brassicae TaxID=86971 RepID=A0A6H5I339_9HYME|nr:unnamed protein product [Trichogramma brassicae]
MFHTAYIFAHTPAIRKIIYSYAMEAHTRVRAGDIAKQRTDIVSSPTSTTEIQSYEIRRTIIASKKHLHLFLSLCEDFGGAVSIARREAQQMSVAVQGNLEITARAASQITRETSLFSSYSRSYVYTRGARPAVYIIYNTRYLHKPAVYSSKERHCLSGSTGSSSQHGQLSVHTSRGAREIAASLQSLLTCARETAEGLHERNVARTPTHTCILWPILDTWQATSHGQPKREMLHADMVKATIDVPFMNESKSISRSWLCECIGLAKLVRLCESEGRRKAAPRCPQGIHAAVERQYMYVCTA